MKLLLVSCFLMATVSLQAQARGETTNQVTIEGKVKNKIRFSLNDLSAYTVKHIDSLVIYNHLMEPKKVIRNIKGVLLKQIIEDAGINETSPKLLSEYYITCHASDGYKVVYSWNELFNTDIGERILIITEADNKKAEQLTDRIALLSASDHATGRRYVKGLQKIVISQVQ